jgi:arylsulfate sulfotransferase
MRPKSLWSFMFLSFTAAGLPTALHAESILVGFNTQTTLQVYSPQGAYQQDFGPAGASAGVEEGGLLYVVQPSTTGGNVSTISALDAGQKTENSFTVSNLIADGAPGANRTLWLAGYDGTVYNVSTGGQVLSSFNTGFTSIGIASNGSTLYTTRGDLSDAIDVRDATEKVISTMFTGIPVLYGLGYHTFNSTLFAGSFAYAYQFTTAGSLLNTFFAPGDFRTPNGAVHDGLEIGDLGALTPITPVPKPQTSGLIGGLLTAGVIAFALRRRVCPRAVRALFLVAAGLSAGQVSFASVNVTLSPAVGPGAPVGTTIRLNAVAFDTTNPEATFTYQFNIGPSGQPLTLRRDFYTFNYFPWTPSDSEGVYNIQVVVRSSTGATGIGSAVYNVSPRATSSPVISPTNHPLVALYSLPSCPVGQTARVRFKLPSDAIWQATSIKTCNGQTSLNFYVAGMRANSTYQLQHDVFNGPFDNPGPVLSFTTGTIPADTVAAYSVTKPFPAPTNTAYPVLLNSAVGTADYATDTTGALIWYLPAPDVTVIFFDRPVEGGTFLVETTDGFSAPSRLLREYDLAGNIVRETNAAVLSQQLIARGADPVNTLHHEALRLADGSTAVLSSVEKVADQGSGPVDVVGDQVLVLDSNFQLTWWWNEFHHFPITRPALLGEKCRAGQSGCEAPTNPRYAVANDWTHSNGIWPSPDGNLVLSSRHQDWIVKIPYANGHGPADGSTIWTLGEGGDFRVVSSDPHPWFSHQHDPRFQPNGLMSVFDNGNTRVTNFGGNSRGQAWSLDEQNMVATLAVNIDLGAFSPATGSTQVLENGNYTFDLGVLNNNTTSSTQEYSASGVLQSELTLTRISYRSFRMRSLYRVE